MSFDHVERIKELMKKERTSVLKRTKKESMLNKLTRKEYIYFMDFLLYW